MIYTTHYASPLGDLLLAENENQLIGLWLEGQKYYCGSLREAAQERSDRAVFAQTADWLDRYFAGEQPAVCELSLAPRGSAFRQAVWKILSKIPYGEVTTYGEIARQLARVDGDVGAGGRRCSRTQSDLDHHSLSPGRRHKRKSDGIRRRVGKENPAAAAGGR